MKANRLRLRLGDLAALDAAGADADALGCAVDQGLDSLQIDVPAAARNVVRVRDVVTELRAFAANIAYLCHDFTPNLCFRDGPDQSPGVSRERSQATQTWDVSRENRRG